MRDFDDDILAYEDDAEDRYDDFDGDYDEDDFDSGFEGHEDSYYEDDFEEEEVEYVDVDDDENYDNYKTSSIGRIDPNDRTLTVVVKNTSGADAEAIVFGANEEAAQPAGVTVVVEESSHKEVREESKANPFKVAGMKLSVSNPLQFDNVLKVVKRTASGSNTERVYQPRNATSPQNFTQTLIDDDNFEMNVTGQDSLRVLVKDGVTLVFTFTIKARANMGNLLKGNNVAELSTVPRTTGLPQIDLLRKKKSTAFGLKPTRKRRVVKRVKRRPSRRIIGGRRPRRLIRRRR
ncbi:hypothetical protein N9R81_02270 [Flavobacteriales bacterium]|nr:hypothetical protein [Flavobacteriales bacterium]